MALATIKFVTSVASIATSIGSSVLKLFGDSSGEIKEKLNELDQKMDELLELGNDIREDIGLARDEAAQIRLGSIAAQAKTAKDAVIDIIDGRPIDPDIAINNARNAVNALLTFPQKDVGVGIAAYVVTTYAATIAMIDDRAFAAEVNAQKLDELEQYIRDGAAQLTEPTPTVTRLWITEFREPELENPPTWYTWQVTFSDGHRGTGMSLNSEAEARAQANAYADRYRSEQAAEHEQTDLLELADFVDELGGGLNLRGNNADNTLGGGAERDFIRGEGGNDRLVGGDGDDSLMGGTGNDNMKGGAGDDYLQGEAGDDIMWGHGSHNVRDGGQNILDGGEGIDSVAYTGSAQGVRVSLLEVDFQDTGVSQDLLINVENLYGSDFGDRLTGDDGGNMLVGLGGDDVIHGGRGRDLLRGDSGRDQLFGGDDDDILRGGDGEDRLYGGEGNDWLHGEGGNDYLYGEGGNDALHGGFGSHFLHGGAGNDRFVVAETHDLAAGLIALTTILDFEGAGAAGGDLIDVSRIDANALVAGHQDFTFGTGIGALNIVNSGSNPSSAFTQVSADVDGDGTADFKITLRDGSVDASVYTPEDFLL